VDNLRLAAETTGKCRYTFGHRVTSLRLSAGRVVGVKLSDGSKIDAPAVLNAAGPHSSAVNAMAFAADGAPPNDMVVTTRPMRQEVAYVKAPPGVDYDAMRGPMMADIDTGVYFRGELGNKILVGSLEPECDKLDWVDSPDNASPSLSDIHTSHVLRLALRFPELELPSASNTQGIVACYDVTEVISLCCSHARACFVDSHHQLRACMGMRLVIATTCTVALQCCTHARTLFCYFEQSASDGVGAVGVCQQTACVKIQTKRFVPFTLSSLCESCVGSHLTSLFRLMLFAGLDPYI
jgi:hypothetical protein